MSVQVSGKITSQPANRDFTEPPAVVTENVASGSTVAIPVGKYVNRGNVEQTLTVSTVNLNNCTTTSLAFTDDNGAATNDTVTLAPHAGASLMVTAEVASEAIGSDPVDFSFEIDSVWS